MAIATPQPQVGSLLRDWRRRRRLTQMELALDAGVSARHLSFVETGRSKPGRDMLLRVVERLDVPFRERNQLLLVAGHAPAFAERALEDPDLAPVREALDLILTHHDPYPAIVVDRKWNVVATNSAAQAMLALGQIDRALLEPPINAMRAGLHPRGLAPYLLNLGQWRAYFLERLERQVATTGDEDLAALLDEVSAYPAPEPDPAARAADPSAYPAPEPDPAAPAPDASGILGPLRAGLPGGPEVSFVGMFAGFGSPFEVTTSELAVELMFPADAATAETLRLLARR
jgi:transcriptional regulator with XRE-family HTH domain